MNKINLYLFAKHNLLTIFNEGRSLKKTKSVKELSNKYLQYNYKLDRILSSKILSLEEGDFNEYLVNLDAIVKNVSGDVIKSTTENTVLNKDGSNLPISQIYLKDVNLIKFVFLEDVKVIFLKLIGSSSNLDQMSLEFIDAFINHVGPNILKDTSEIKNKNTLGYITKSASKILDKNQLFSFLLPKISNVNDILRIASALSGGSTNLADTFIFKLSNKSKNLISMLLNAQKRTSSADMIKYSTKWKSLAHCLHIAANKKKYPIAFILITELRNKKPLKRSFGSNLENLVEKTLLIRDANSFNALVFHLIKRPGEFIRRLDFLLRLDIDSDLVIKNLHTVAKKVETRVLLQALGNFKARLVSKNDNRFYVPAATTKRFYFDKESKRYPILNNILVLTIKALERAIANKQKQEKVLKNVFIDESLKNHKLPMSLKGSSFNTQSLTKGSVIPLDTMDKKNDNLRFFLYWKNKEPKTPIDLDLSVALLNKDFELINYIDYTNLYDELGSVHSYDVVDAPDGASEFIDVNKKALKDNGVKYLVSLVFCFNGDGFEDYNTFTGVMNPTKNFTKENYSPFDVIQKIDLKGEGKGIIPFIIDLEDELMYWSDIPNVSSISGMNVYRAKYLISNAVEGFFIQKDRIISVYELLELNALKSSASIYSKKENLEKIDYCKVYDKEFYKNEDELLEMMR